MHQVYLGLGSNLGDRLNNLKTAVVELNQIGEVTAKSSVFETEPWGEENQPKFLNACVAFKTEETAEDLLETVKRIEQKIGRTETYRWGPRSIDIDILFFDDEIISSQRLTVPHPGLVQRAFVLVPLVQIGGKLIHPVLEKPVVQLAAAVDGNGVTESLQQW